MPLPEVNHHALATVVTSDDSIKESKSHGSGIEELDVANTFRRCSVFDDPALAHLYMPPDSYENKHRFDPTARWTEAEERAVVRKCDLCILSFVCLGFAALQLDRGNISNALADNLLGDLGLTTADFNLGQTIFYVCFLFMELPSQLISKKIGVERWVPIQMVLWSVVAICQSQIKNRAGFFATRALLAGLEGGFIPNMILYLSYFYTSDELVVRLSVFWATFTLTGVIGTLLSVGLLQMRGIQGWAGWQYLFLIEGLITLAIGLFAAVWLPASPTQTAGWVRGKKGWFSEREEVILVSRILRDDPSKSSMHHREPIGPKELWRSLSDFDLFPIYALGLTTFIAPGTVAAYFVSPNTSFLTFPQLTQPRLDTLRSLGFNTFHTNLLTIPASVLNALNNLGISFFSRRVKERAMIASIGSWWLLVGFIAIVTIPDSTSAWSKYALLVVTLSYPVSLFKPVSTFHIDIFSENSGSVRTRAVSASLYNIVGQLGGIISSNIYEPSDRPYYHRGNRVLIGIISANIVLFFVAKAWFIYRNRTRAKVWESLTAEQRAHYLATTKDEGNRRLDFVFVH
ncbi:hypothetical protein RQP46_011207 [Phenoliferia psychrophenolica]